MRLYEINEQIYKLLNQEIVDPETGEIFDINGFDQLKELEAKREDKLENTALFIKNLEAEVEAFKAEEKNLSERRKTKENKLNWVRRFLSDFLISEDVNKFETARCRLSFRKSESVVVDDVDLLPDELKKKEVTVSPDRTAIKKAIKAGIELKGARIVEKQNLQVK